MRRSYPISVGALWGEMVAGDRTLSRLMTEASLSDIWGEIVGEPIASATESVELKDGMMTVRIASAVLRNEVFIRRIQLAEQINSKLRQKVVNYISVK